MNNDLLVIILLVLILILLVLIGVVGFMGWRFLKMQNRRIEKEVHETNEDLRTGHNPVKGDGQRPRHELNQELLKSLRAKGQAAQEKFRPAVCVDHPDRTSHGVCALSGDHYCEDCLSRADEVVIARKFMDYFLSFKWEEVLMIPSTDMNDDVSTRLNKIKGELWAKQEIPLIIQGHYKINIEHDNIESFTVILARTEDTGQIKKELSFLH
jgi:hypothetical protein